MVLEPQPEGGYTVTSPLLPELITEGDTISECMVNVEDAFAVVLEIYEDDGRSLPQVSTQGQVIKSKLPKSRPQV